MDRKHFLSNSLKTAEGIILAPSLLNEKVLGASAHLAAGEAEELDPPGLLSFAQIPLPYAYEALEPCIDKLTMEIHYSKHHAAYVKNVNEAIKDEGIPATTGEELLQRISTFSAKVRNNGGGAWNHSFFWQVMAPGKGATPTGRALDALNGSFASFENFKEAFTDAAMKRFGSSCSGRRPCSARRRWSSASRWRRFWSPALARSPARRPVRRFAASSWPSPALPAPPDSASGLALAVTRSRSAALQERLWKLAALASLFTAPLQLLIAEHFGDRSFWSLPAVKFALNAEESASREAATREGEAPAEPRGTSSALLPTTPPEQIAFETLDQSSHRMPPERSTHTLPLIETDVSW